MKRITFRLFAGMAAVAVFTACPIEPSPGFDFTQTKRIYWISSNKIKRAEMGDIAGTTETVINDLGFAAETIDIDSVRGKMYLTENGATRRILRANLDGSGIETIITVDQMARDICIDMERGKLYYIDDPYIRRSNLDGTGTTDLLDQVGLGAPYNRLAIDASGRRLFWTGNNPEGVFWGDLDCKNGDQIYTGDAQNDLALDTRNGKIYFSPNLGTQGFRRIDLDGSNPVTINIGEVPWHNFKIDFINGKIYFNTSNGSAGCIKQCNLDGTGLNTVILEDNLLAVYDLAFEYE